MGILIAEIPVFLLTAGKGKTQFLISSVLFFAILASMMVIRKDRNRPFRPEIQHPIIDTVISTILALLFFYRWGFSGRMNSIAEFLNMPVKQCCMLIAFLLALFSLFGIDLMITTVQLLLPPRDANKKQPGKLFLIFYLFFISVLILFIHSKCSPLYPFQDGNDQNTMFTVGKGVLKGYVPYRDLYEQKGPLLIFIHSFGAAFNYYGFEGIWLLEIICCFFFLLITYKTTEIFVDNKALPFIPLFAAVIYSAPAFGMGDSAEEFALPLMAYAFYVAIKALKNDSFLSAKEFFFIGLTSGAVFWIKYSMVGFYFGWIACFLFYAISRRQMKDLLSGILLIAAGILVITLPVFLYFLFNSALKDLYQAYFYNNLVYYPAYRNWSYAKKLRYSMMSYRTNALIPMGLSIIGCFYMIIKKQWKTAAFLIITFLPTYLFVYISGNYHFYYCFIFSIFSITGLCFFTDLFSNLFGFIKKPAVDSKKISAPLLFTALIMVCLVSKNLPSLEIPKNELLPFRMKDIIEKSGIEDPSILHFRILDMGVNTAAGLIPNMKYFCYYNNDHLTETLEQQLQCLEEHCVDYVLEQSTSPYTWQEIETYEHQGVIPSWQDKDLYYFHYFTPKR